MLYILYTHGKQTSLLSRPLGLQTTLPSLLFPRNAREGQNARNFGFPVLQSPRKRSRGVRTRFQSHMFHPLQLLEGDPPASYACQMPWTHGGRNSGHLQSKRGLLIQKRHCAVLRECAWHLRENVAMLWRLNECT